MAGDPLYEGLINIVLNDNGTPERLSALIGLVQQELSKLSSLPAAELGPKIFGGVEGGAKVAGDAIARLKAQLASLESTPTGAGKAALEPQIAQTKQLIGMVVELDIAQKQYTLDSIRAAEARSVAIRAEAVAYQRAAEQKRLAANEAYRTARAANPPFNEIYGPTGRYNNASNAADINRPFTPVASSVTTAPARALAAQEAALGAATENQAEARMAAAKGAIREGDRLEIATSRLVAAEANAATVFAHEGEETEKSIGQRAAANARFIAAQNNLAKVEEEVALRQVSLSGVTVGSSARIQQAQTDIAIAEAKLKVLTAVGTGYHTEVEINAARIQVLAAEERLVAAVDREAVASKKASIGSGGLGIGSSFKYFAFYQIFSIVERGLHGLVTTTGQYSLAVNQLSIAMNTSFTAAEKAAEGFAAIGGALATKPAVAINAATEYGRFFGQSDGQFNNSAATIGAQLGSTINLLEAKTAKDGEEEALVKKRLSEIAAISLNYGLTPQGGADLYSAATVIAQRLGVGAVGGGGGGGGALLGGTAQISDLLKANGFSPEQGLALMASVMQRTGDTSEAAASDVKRVLGRSGTNPLNALLRQYKIDTNQSFKQQLDELGSIFKSLPEDSQEKKNIIAHYGGSRVGNVVVPLLETADETDALAKAGKERPKAAADQAAKELATFAGYLKLLHGDLGVLAADLSQSGLGGVFKLLLASLDPIVIGLDQIIKGLNLLPTPLTAATYVLGLLALAGKKMGGVAATTAFLDKRSIFASSAAGGPAAGSTGANTAALAAQTAAIRANTLAHGGEADAQSAAATAATATTGATERLAAANLAYTDLSNAAGAATNRVTAAMALYIEATQATIASEIELEGAQTAFRGHRAGATTRLAAAEEAVTAATIAETEASTALAAAQEAAAAAQGEAVVSAQAFVAAEEGVVVASAEATAAQERLAAAELAAGGGAVKASAGLFALTKSLVGAAIALGPLALAIGGLILIGNTYKRDQALQASAAEYDAAVGSIRQSATRPGDVGGVLSSINALDTAQNAIDKNAKGFVAGFQNFFVDLYGAVKGEGGGSVEKAFAAHRAEYVANRESALVILANAQKVLAESLKHPKESGGLGAQLFGQDYGAVDAGISALAGSRASAKSSALALRELLGHTSPDDAILLGKELTPEQGTKGIGDEIARIMKVASKERTPVGELASLRTLQPIAARALALAGQSKDENLIAAAEAISDTVNKSVYDRILKSVNARIASIKAFEGDNKKSQGEIKAILTNALTETAAGGDVDSTIALLGIMSVAQITEFKKIIADDRAILDKARRDKLALLKVAVAAAKNDPSVVRHDASSLLDGFTGANASGSGPVDLFSSVGSGNAKLAAAQKAYDKALAADNKNKKIADTIDRALPYSAPTGSASQFPKEKAAATGPTAAQIEEARLGAQAIPGDPLSGAIASLNVARYKMSQPKDKAEYWNALKALHEAQYAYAQAQQSAANDAFQLHLDLTNPLIVAREKVRESAALLAADIGRGALSDVTNKDRLALKQDKSAAEKTAFDQTFSDHATNYNLQRESLSAYLSYLNAQHNYLTHVKNKTRQQVDELNQVDQALKGLSDSMQGQFNIGQIKVPSAYEVRRIQAVGGANTNVQITINGADIVAVKGIIAQYIGQGAMATTGSTVRKV